MATYLQCKGLPDKLFYSKARITAQKTKDAEAAQAIEDAKADDAQEELAEKLFQIALANRLGLSKQYFCISQETNWSNVFFRQD